MYLGWYDPDKKKSAKRKLAEAVERYEQKWGRTPSVALVNVSDVTDFPGVEIRVAANVAPNTFFVGEDEAENEEEALAA